MPVTCPSCGKQYRDPAPGTRVTVKCTGCGNPFEAAAADAPPAAPPPVSAGAPDAGAPTRAVDPAVAARLRKQGRRGVEAGAGPRGRRPFQVGKVVGRAFSAWFTNLIPFTLLGLVIFAPLFALTWVVTRGVDPLLALQYGQQLSQIGGQFLQVVLEAALVFGVFQRLRNQRASIAACVAKGFSRLLPVLVAAFVAAAITYTPIIAGRLLGNAMGEAGGVLLLPALIVTLVLRLIFFVTVPVVVVESTSLVDALKRSAFLTKRCRPDIFGALILVNLFSIGVGCMIGLPLGVSAAASNNSAMFAFAPVVATALLAPLGASLTAVIYHDLRVAKEGVSIEDLAKVFD